MNPVSPVIPNPWSRRNMPNEYQPNEVVYAKVQPEYNPLPSIKLPDGCVITRWQMSWRERLRAFFTGSIYLEVLTFNQRLQPLKMSTEPPQIDPAPRREWTPEEIWRKAQVFKSEPEPR